MPRPLSTGTEVTIVLGVLLIAVSVGSVLGRTNQIGLAVGCLLVVLGLLHWAQS